MNRALAIVACGVVVSAGFLVLFEFGHLQIFRSRVFLLLLIVPILCLFLWSVSNLLKQNRKR